MIAFGRVRRKTAGTGSRGASTGATRRARSCRARCRRTSCTSPRRRQVPDGRLRVVAGGRDQCPRVRRGRDRAFRFDRHDADLRAVGAVADLPVAEPLDLHAVLARGRAGRRPRRRKRLGRLRRATRYAAAHSKAIKSSRINGIWRRDRDSNPGWACTHNGFRDRPVRPLRHLSAGLGEPDTRLGNPAQDTLAGIQADPCPASMWLLQSGAWSGVDRSMLPVRA